MKPLLLLFLQPKCGREVAGSRRRRLLLLLRGRGVARCPTVVTQTPRVRIHRATVLPSPPPRSLSLQALKCCWSRKDDSFGVGGGETTGEDGDVLRTGTVPAAAAAASAPTAVALLPLSDCTRGASIDFLAAAAE